MAWPWEDADSATCGREQWVVSNQCPTWPPWLTFETQGQYSSHASLHKLQFFPEMQEQVVPEVRPFTAKVRPFTSLITQG